MNIDTDLLIDFINESNEIEGIEYMVEGSIELYRNFLELEKVSVDDVCNFVNREAGSYSKLRVKAGMSVRIGNHFPPDGGPAIRKSLQGILDYANTNSLRPHRVHWMYENLHPFMDGNGRSGRVLWAWQMIRYGGYHFQLPFLQMFYYQVLGDRPTL